MLLRTHGVFPIKTCLIQFCSYFVPILSYYIFSALDSQEANKKFVSTMKVYIFNSLLFCLNDTILGVIWFTTTKAMYENDACIFQLWSWYGFMVYFTYFRMNFTAVTYTFGGIMDIYIAYTRIQMLKPNYKLFSKTSVKLFFDVVNLLSFFGVVKSVCR